MRREHRGRCSILTGIVQATVLSVSVAGCASQDDRRIARARALVSDGNAKRLLQAYFDRHPQCSRLPIGPIFDYVGGNDKPMVKALLDAGLLAARPLGDSLHTVHYEPTSAALRWIPPEQAPLAAPRRLCFGYRRIAQVFVDEADRKGDIHYTFTLIRPAPWVNSTPVVAAAPNLAAAFGEGEFVGTDPIAITDGKLDVSLIMPTDTYALFDRLGVSVEGAERRRAERKP